MSYRIGIDAGGTFTDLIAIDENNKILSAKVPTTPEAPSKGVFNAIEQCAEQCGKSVEELLGETILLVHGTTMAVNTVINRAAAKTGLICTKGFRGILVLPQQNKEDTWNHKVEPPEPYVPMYLTLPVSERIDRDGNEVIPLSEEDVRQAIRKFKKWNVEAIAVSLLWSFANPAHEQRIGEIIEEEWPGMDYSLSSYVQPVIREWQRTSATVIDASLKPLLREYAGNLHDGLRKSNFKNEFLIVIANGGVLPGMTVSDRPVYNCLSGPAMGPVAGLFFSKQKKVNNVITVDMGGTSFDICVVREGVITTTRMAKVEEFILGISSIDVNSIGSGGGSIARVDAQGLVVVGPDSQGAVPGPACYMRGGDKATVTDADVVLGYINPEYFLGGKMEINPEAAVRVIDSDIAKPLKIDIYQAAIGICKIVNQNMVNGIIDISLKSGIDPRDFLLVVGGGAGGMHAVGIARELGMKQIMIPRISGAFCAFGMLIADIRSDNVGSLYVETDSLDCDEANRLIIRLEEQGRTALLGGGVDVEDIKYEYYVGMRYPFQVYEIDTIIKESRLTPENLAQLVEDFHSLHEKLYGFRDVTQSPECVYWRVVAVVPTGEVTQPDIPSGGDDSSHALMGNQKAYFEEAGGFVKTLHYNGVKLLSGNKIYGPAIIHEIMSTTVIPPGAKATITVKGDCFIELE